MCTSPYRTTLKSTLSSYKPYNENKNNVNKCITSVPIKYNIEFSLFLLSGLWRMRAWRCIQSSLSHWKSLFAMIKLETNVTAYIKYQVHNISICKRKCSNLVGFCRVIYEGLWIRNAYSNLYHIGNPRLYLIPKKQSG